MLTVLRSFAGAGPHILKCFKLFSIGCKMVFSPHISAFYYSVALLCSAKKLKTGTKILIFHCNQKSLNHFMS
ncbi:MAG: hypothetical protein CFE24_13845 [Flavobacterium sp. BFFFF2]|nr:MAG: hypothetical protein CFE24_13845 [Flavobacterium sp. BFFFF2]